jgi:hypothetical protein
VRITASRPGGTADAAADFAREIPSCTAADAAAVARGTGPQEIPRARERTQSAHPRVPVHEASMSLQTLAWEAMTDDQLDHRDAQIVPGTGLDFRDH